MEEPKIEIGYGVGRGDDAFATGVEAARQAMAGIYEQPLASVLVFASVCYDLEALLGGIHSVVGKAPVLGTTTAGEICDGSQQNSVVVVALASSHLSVRVGVGTAVSRDWQKAVSQAVSAPQMQPFFSPQDGAFWPELTRQGRSAFALLFSPGNTRHADSRSYEILEELKRLSGGRLPLFGGSAADDWRMEENDVLLGQRAYPDSVLVAVFETRLRFGIALAHGFRPGSRRAVVTRSRGHEVVELDGRSGAEVYAEMLGTSREALEGKHLTLTAKRPAGSPDPYGQYSINVASYFTPQGGVRFAQPVPEGTSLAIMEADPDHVIAAGPEALRKALLRSGTAAPAVIFCFSCALRSRILGERTGEEIAGIQEMVPGVPVVGFYSFGEQGLADDGVNRHNNEVIAVLVLGQELSYAAQVALENERLREELRESENRFRSVVAQAYDGICLTDERGRVLEWNQALERITGLKAQDVLTRPIWDVQFQMATEEERTPETYEQLKAELVDFLGTGRAPWADRVLEREYVRPDGRRLFVQGVVSSVTMDRGFVLVSTCRDVTEPRQAEEALRKAHDELEMRVKERTAELESANRASQIEIAERERAAQALQESEERLRLALEATSEGLWENNFGRKPDYFSDRMYTMLGYEPVDPAKGFQCFDSLLHADDRERFESACQGLDEPGNDDYAIEFRLKARDGGWRHVLSRGKCIERDDQGRAVRVLGTHTDITARVQMEEAYRTLVEHSLQGLAILQDGRVVFANPAVAEMTGYAVEELLSLSPEEVRAAAHADDRERVWRTREDYLAGRAAPARHEFRLIRRDGTVRWVETLASRITYQGKSALQIAYVDVTERKRTERLLREQNDLVLSVLDSLSHPFYVIDGDDYTIKIANSAAYEGELSETATCYALMHRRDMPCGEVGHSCPLEEIKKTKKPVVVEHIHHDREGNRRTFEVHGHPILDNEGNVARIIEYSLDITERKRAERALHRSLEENTRSRRLLLALSRAAQAVERARTTDEVYRVVGEEISALDYQATVFTLTEDRTHLAVSHLTFDSALLRAAEKLTGLSVQGYRFRLTPGGFLQRIIDEGEAAFTHNDNQPFLEALPGAIRPLAGRLMDLLGMEQSIVIPLTIGGEVRGLLAVTGDGLTEADVSAVAAFANQAAIALENAELLATVTEQRRELRGLSTRLIKAQEEERGRLSRELHDEIGQALTAMSINVAEIEKRLPPELVPQIGERLAETSALAEQMSERISALALDLRPSLLDDLGLVPALRWYVSRYTDRLGIEVQVEAVDLEERLDPEVETTLYRVVQEALTNVARHARATNVRLRLERKVSSVAATIGDNGQGFDSEELAGRKAPERGAGLLGMRERVTLLGGNFRVESVPGDGTELSVEIPLRWRGRS